MALWLAGVLAGLAANDIQTSSTIQNQISKGVATFLGTDTANIRILGLTDISSRRRRLVVAASQANMMVSGENICGVLYDSDMFDTWCGSCKRHKL